MATRVNVRVNVPNGYGVHVVADGNNVIDAYPPDNLRERASDELIRDLRHQRPLPARRDPENNGRRLPEPARDVEVDQPIQRVDQPTQVQPARRVEVTPEPVIQPAPPAPIPAQPLVQPAPVEVPAPAPEPAPLVQPAPVVIQPAPAPTPTPAATETPEAMIRRVAAEYNYVITDKEVAKLLGWNNLDEAAVRRYIEKRKRVEETRDRLNELAHAAGIRLFHGFNLGWLVVNGKATIEQIMADVQAGLDYDAIKAKYDPDAAPRPVAAVVNDPAVEERIRQDLVNLGAEVGFTPEAIGQDVFDREIEKYLARLLRATAQGGNTYEEDRVAIREDMTAAVKNLQQMNA